MNVKEDRELTNKELIHEDYKDTIEKDNDDNADSLKLHLLEQYGISFDKNQLPCEADVLSNSKSIKERIFYKRNIIRESNLSYVDKSIGKKDSSEIQSGSDDNLSLNKVTSPSYNSISSDCCIDKVPSYGKSSSENKNYIRRS